MTISKMAPAEVLPVRGGASESLLPAPKGCMECIEKFSCLSLERQTFPHRNIRRIRHENYNNVCLCSCPCCLYSVSGMSPFLGDDDSQTLSNVLAVNWYFDEEAFEHVSAEAKDFIANLLIREKG